MTLIHVIDILLVEDNDADAELTARVLRKGGVLNDIVRLRDGTEAMDLIRREGSAGGYPRLMLLDLHMPRLGGIEVIRQLKSDPATSRIPIIVLTESAQARDVIDGYNLGISGYLIKPISAAAFTEVVIQVGLYWSVTSRVES